VRALALMSVRLGPVFTFLVSHPDLTMSCAGVAAVLTLRDRVSRKYLRDSAANSPLYSCNAFCSTY
jgi:hypothetical protein